MRSTKRVTTWKILLHLLVSLVIIDGASGEQTGIDRENAYEVHLIKTCSQEDMIKFGTRCEPNPNFNMTLRIWNEHTPF